MRHSKVNNKEELSMTLNHDSALRYESPHSYPKHCLIKSTEVYVLFSKNDPIIIKLA